MNTDTYLLPLVIAAFILRIVNVYYLYVNICLQKYKAMI
jgi:hypothetical protein